jgi:hypothetical protein
MERSIKLTSHKLPQQPFLPVYSNADNVLISFGPENGLLWRGEAIDPQKTSLIDGLNKVFQHGFAQRNEQSVLARLPYLSAHYPTFTCASNAYSNGGELIGLNHEKALAGNYGYVYLIDSNYHNGIQSIPLCEENINNSNFVAGYRGDINQGPDYAIISTFNSAFIIGAVPSEFVAFALGINEKSFIINPIYHGVIYLDKIREASGISMFLTSGNLALKYPNLSIDQIYQRYLGKSYNVSPDLLSLPSSSGAGFFQSHYAASASAVLSPEPSLSSDSADTQYQLL